MSAPAVVIECEQLQVKPVAPGDILWHKRGYPHIVIGFRDDGAYRIAGRDSCMHPDSFYAQDCTTRTHVSEYELDGVNGADVVQAYLFAKCVAMAAQDSMLSLGRCESEDGVLHSGGVTVPQASIAVEYGADGREALYLDEGESDYVPPSAEYAELRQAWVSAVKVYRAAKERVEALDEVIKGGILN